MEWENELLSAGRVTFETVARRKCGDVIPVEVTMHLLGNRGKWQAMDIVRELVREADPDAHEFKRQVETEIR